MKYYIFTHHLGGLLIYRRHNGINYLRNLVIGHEDFVKAYKQKYPKENVEYLKKTHGWEQSEVIYYI